MIPLLLLPLRHPLLNGVWMNQHRQRSSPYRQPGNKRPKLRGSKNIHLEHGNGVRADGSVPEGVDAQFRELAADALPELAGVLGLGEIGLVMVDVNITVNVREITLYLWHMGEGLVGTNNPPRLPLSSGSTNLSYAGLSTPVWGFWKLLPSSFR